MAQLAFFSMILSLIVSCSSGSKNEVNERRAQLLYSQGTSNLVNQEYTEALQHLLQANQAKPGDSSILNNLGMAYFFKGEPALAKQHIRQAVRVDPKNSDARNNLASILFNEGSLDEAKREYEIVSRDLLYRHQYRIKYNLALIHLRQQNRADAVRLLKEASSAREDYCAADYQLGLLYRESRNLEKAIEWFTKASSGTCYGEPAPHYQLGELFEMTNQYERARDKYEDIIERFPQTSFMPASRARISKLKENEQVARRINTPLRFEPEEKSSPRFQSPRF